MSPGSGSESITERGKMRSTIGYDEDLTSDAWGRGTARRCSAEATRRRAGDVRLRCLSLCAIRPRYLTLGFDPVCLSCVAGEIGSGGHVAISLGCSAHNANIFNLQSSYQPPLTASASRRAELFRGWQWRETLLFFFPELAKTTRARCGFAVSCMYSVVYQITTGMEMKFVVQRFSGQASEEHRQPLYVVTFFLNNKVSKPS